LQAATAGNDREMFKQYSALNTRLSRKVHLRGLLRFRAPTMTPAAAAATAAGPGAAFVPGVGVRGNPQWPSSSPLYGQGRTLHGWQMAAIVAWV
jgi:hypothetical protein